MMSHIIDNYDIESLRVGIVLETVKDLYKGFDFIDKYNLWEMDDTMLRAIMEKKRFGWSKTKNFFDAKSFLLDSRDSDNFFETIDGNEFYDICEEFYKRGISLHKRIVDNEFNV